MTIKGTWADGTPMLAIPNYARFNRDTTQPVDRRVPKSIVWMTR
jgi:hypothetical protein